MIVPSMNTLWFWFGPQEERRRLNGHPVDCMRKFQTLEQLGVADNGVEIYIMPRRASAGFEPWFYDAFRKRGWRTVHTGDPAVEFLMEPDAPRHLSQLHEQLVLLGADRVVLHAHHLEHHRAFKRDLLAECLPGIQVLVENTSFECEWGARPGALLGLFEDCPDYGLCLDITHIKDFEWGRLSAFLDVSALRDRIVQTHLAYSPHLLGYDPYERLGYPAYGPLHVLFSAMDQGLSDKTRQRLSAYPAVVEGLLPPEDAKGELLRREMSLLD